MTVSHSESLPFATPADVARLERQLQDVCRFVRELVESVDDQVSTQQALKLTGLKSRTTLIAERKRPGTLLKYTKQGRSTAYSRASCIAHKLHFQLAA